MIVYRQLLAIEEYDEIVQLERIIWGMNDDDVTPTHIMAIISRNGGVVLGALDDGRLIGFVIGWPGWRDDERYLWSHVAGVLPEYQHQGIGQQIKFKQREWALDNGYTQIRWTFDPLQRQNANFNIRRLGVTCNVYHENIYGEMQDALNAGMRGDRMEANWNLKGDRVLSILAGETVNTGIAAYPDELFLVRHNDGEVKTMTEIRANEPFYFVEIPYHLGNLKQTNLNLAREWQRAVGKTMQAAFRQGHHTADLVMQENRSWYVLQKRSAS